MSDIKSTFPQLYHTLSDTSDRIVFFFGAGISAALAGKSYSWEQWVRDGIALLPDADKRQIYHERLGDTDDKKASPSADTLTAVLEDLTDDLKSLAGVYEKWMHNAFEVLSVRDLALAATLKELLTFQDFFVTTNYDALLEQATGAGAVSWLHPEIAYPMLDEKRNDHIVHIHGRYSTKPHDAEDSIIATDTQYKALLANQGAQFIQNVIGTRTVIYAGCGKTTSDQNISRFITFAKEYLKLNKTSYFLYKADAKPDDLPDQVEPVCYGSDYGDLPVFLEDMAKARLDAFVRTHTFIELFPAAVTAKMRTALPPYYFAAEELTFYGRTSELRVIESFMDGKAACLWYALTGQSGSGKSRLALEICHRYGSHWCTFFIRPYADASLLDAFVPYRDTLIVIDDFKGLEKNVAGLVEKASSLFEKTNYRLRILFCERESSSISGTWFEDLERSFGKGWLPAFRSRRYGGESQKFLVLGDLEDQEIEDMIGEICAKKGLPPDRKRNCRLRQSYKGKLEQLSYRPLFLQMYVESWIENGCSATRFDSASGLLEDILKREQERWLMELDGSYELFESWTHLLLLGVVGGRLTKISIPDKYAPDFDAILSYIKSHSFPGKQRQERFISLIADMCHSLSQDDAYIEPMYPDIIKEYCFLYYLDMDSAAGFSKDLWEFAPDKFSRYLVKILGDFPYNDIAYAAIDGDKSYRYRTETLQARVHVLDSYILQKDDDINRIHAWNDREYAFWHQMAGNDDGSDELKTMLIFTGLDMAAQQYGAQDAPWNRTIDKMLSVYGEALDLKGGEALDLVRMVQTQKMAKRLSSAGMEDRAEKLLAKVNSAMATDSGKMLAEETRLEQFNTAMMGHLLEADFWRGYDVLKKALSQARKLHTANALSYFLGMCHRFGRLASFADQERYIGRAEHLADQTAGLFEDDTEVSCTRLLIRLNRIDHQMLTAKEAPSKAGLIQIYEAALGKKGKAANECLAISGTLLLNLADGDEEIIRIKEAVRDRLDSLAEGEENGDDLAQAYMKCAIALKKAGGRIRFTKEEIEDAYALMLRYPESEPVRDIFMDMLDRSPEAGNRTHYLRREVLTAAASDAMYHPTGFFDMDEPDPDFDPPYQPAEPLERVYRKIGANEPCPCGSGKKFKKCCRGNGRYD